jgi:hypothetical protein
MIRHCPRQNIQYLQYRNRKWLGEYISGLRQGNLGRDAYPLWSSSSETKNGSRAHLLSWLSLPLAVLLKGRFGSSKDAKDQHACSVARIFDGYANLIAS